MTTLTIRRFDSTTADFRAAFSALLDRAQELDARVEGVVREVIAGVRTRGDSVPNGIR